MANTNIIQDIPAEVVAQALTGATDLKTLLSPYLISLTPYDRKALYKVSDGTDPFVDKGIAYTQQCPQFIPNQLDVKELNIDYNVKTVLLPLVTNLTALLSMLNDTHMMAGAEALQGVLSYYNSAKQAAKENVPNAKEVYNDMKKRYARTKKSDVKPENKDEKKTNKEAKAENKEVKGENKEVKAENKDNKNKKTNEAK